MSWNPEAGNHDLAGLGGALELFSTFVWPWYFIACVFFFMDAIRYHSAIRNRWGMGTLAMALVCFGTGRFLFWADPQNLLGYDWIFRLGHLSLCASTILYVFNSFADRSKTPANLMSRA